MEAKELLLNRHSIRKFTDELVSHELINEVVEVAKFAPSWKNFQVTRFNIIENKEVIQKMADQAVKGFSYNVKTLSNANQVCVLSYVKDLSGKHEDGTIGSSKGTTWEVFDSGIMAYSFCLAAHERGIGTVIMGVFDDEEIKKLVDIPKNETVAALITFGLPVIPGRPTPRKGNEELVRFL